MTEAMSFGAEISEVAARVTGLQTIFGAGVSGAYGGVAWLTSLIQFATFLAPSSQFKKCC
jgi:hypothetical protein